MCFITVKSPAVSTVYRYICATEALMGWLPSTVPHLLTWELYSYVIPIYAFLWLLLYLWNILQASKNQLYAGGDFWFGLRFWGVHFLLGKKDSLWETTLWRRLGRSCFTAALPSQAMAPSEVRIRSKFLRFWFSMWIIMEIRSNCSLDPGLWHSNILAQGVKYRRSHKKSTLKAS